MRFLTVLSMVCVFLVGGMQPVLAQDSSSGNMMNDGRFFWGRADSSFVRPYLEEGKTPINSRWDDGQWRPHEWVVARGSAQAVIDGFYEADIVTDQYLDDGTPVLEVGQGFLDLSAIEQRRVTAFMDHVFHVTAAHEKNSYLIVFEDNGQAVGVFTPQGLQLQ